MLAEAFLRSGKVRDMYGLDGGRVVLVASDRISAFDVILPSIIPDKGRVLTGLSRFWFAETQGLVANHLLDTSVEALVGDAGPDLDPRDELRGRIMVCRRARVVPIEAVVRGYLSGSGWKEYRERGTVCEIPLPPGLRESDRLPEPIFTPATKAELGAHDVNISFDAMIEHIATDLGDADPGTAGAAAVRSQAGRLAEAIRDRALALYRHGARVAVERGILLADTKFEFGLSGAEEGDGPYAFDDAVGPAERLLLIDEVMTPDSSRFWDAAAYEPGRPQASFDKQFVRDWLEARPWDKTAPGPALPSSVVAGTRARYIEAFERITGASFERYLREDRVAP